MDIGTAIKEMRMRHGILQQELALKVGISANALCRIERGYSFPRKETITAICKDSVSALKEACNSFDEREEKPKETFAPITYKLRRTRRKSYEITK